MGDLDPKVFSTCDNGVVSFERDIRPILEKLKEKFRSYRYNLLTNNCNHFTTEFLQLLYDGKRQLPGYVNRASRFGGLFSCIIPERYLNNTRSGKEAEA